MKNIVIAILLVATVALGAFCIHQQKQIAQTETQLAETETQLASVQSQLQDLSGADKQIAQAQKKSEILQETLVKTSAFADEKSKQAEQLQQKIADAKTNSPMSGMAALFKDPKMREMIKTQQQAFMGPMIDKQYKDFFQQLNLTPDQAAGLKDLLQKKMLVGADAGMAMLDGSMDAAKRADLAKQMKSQTADYDAQIKQYLGDDNYKTFQSYEQTVPDRMAVSQFSDQMASSSTPLNADQQQQLIQAMHDERTSFKWTTDYSNQQKMPEGDMSAMFSPDKIDQFTKEKEQFDQQFLNRAQQILTPEQAAAYQSSQKLQRDLQITGMKMAAQMFGPKGQ
jgi:hypothetical protein